MICWTFRQNVALGLRTRATFCLQVQHIICCPHHQSIIVLLYLHWFRIKYSIQTTHKQTDLRIYTFVVSRAFMAGAASQAGDADSSRASGLTSGLQGSVDVHRGALLLVPQ